MVTPNVVKNFPTKKSNNASKKHSINNMRVPQTQQNTKAAQRCPASGRQRGRQPATVGRACWPWHGLSWNCHWIWRTIAMARNRPWQTCWRTRATPSTCRPAACPPAHEAATDCSTTLGALEPTGHTFVQAKKGRRPKKKKLNRALFGKMKKTEKVVKTP